MVDAEVVEVGVSLVGWAKALRSPPDARWWAAQSLRPPYKRLNRKQERSKNMATTTRYAPADLTIVDPKIAHPLGKLRGIIRRYVAVEGVLAVILFLAAWFWLAMLIDYGVFK